MKKSLLLLSLFAVCFILSATYQNVFAANAPRKVLAEEFTNASCGPCASQNPAFQAWLEEHKDNVIPVVYHAWWPGAKDPMYLYDTVMQNRRIAYYKINGVPMGLLNGHFAPPLGSSYEGSVGDTVSLSAYLAQQPVESPYAIKIVVDNLGNSGSVTIDVSASGQALTPVKLRVAVCEKYHYYASAGSNGEKDFYYLARHMLPDFSGTDISLTDGETKNFKFDFTIDPDFSEDLYVVAYLQDDATKNILQAESAIDIPDYTLTANFTDGGVGTSEENALHEVQYTVMNNTDKELKFNVTAEKSERTPSDWSAEASTVDGQLTVAANTSSKVKMKFTCGQTAAIGDACLVVSPVGQTDKKLKGNNYTLVSEKIQTIQVLDGEKEHSLEAYAQKFKGMYSFQEILSANFLKICDKLTNLKCMIWNTSTTGTISPLENGMFINWIDRGMNLMVTGGQCADGMAQNGSIGFFGVRFSYWCSEGYGSAPNRVWLSGVKDDPITGFFGTVKEGNLIQWLTPILEINEPTSTKPILNHSKHKDSVIAVRAEKVDNQRLILLAFNPYIIVDNKLRDTLIMNCLNWLETGTTPVEENTPENSGLTLTASPNPAGNTINISYSIGNASREFRLSISDISGEEIRCIKSGVSEPGACNVAFNTDGLSSGSYRLVLNAGGKVVSYPVVVVK